MSRKLDAGVPGHLAIPSRRVLLGLVAAFAGLVLGFTAATPGRADRQLIERTMDLVTFGGCSECHAPHDFSLGLLPGPGHEISLHDSVQPY
jgi:hypothetical protein